MIYVTHDQVEAMTLADKIVVLRGGNIEQVGAPVELYERPRNMFVAQFIGSPKMNFFSPQDLAGGAALTEAQVLGVRPEHLTLADPADAMLRATPDLIENLGEYALVHCKTPSGAEFIAKTTDMARFTKGEEITLTAAPNRLHYFDKATEQRLTA
jgi:ABC-type sugar transport system ATPase subunit